MQISLSQGDKVGKKYGNYLFAWFYAMDRRTFHFHLNNHEDEAGTIFLKIHL